VVLLIDEIDKADPEVEAFLLEVLSDFQVSVPELGTLKARNRPAVVLTSNRARDLSEALLRRCLHLFVDFPGAEKEAEIIALKVPGLDGQLRGQVARFIAGLRKLDLAKAPSIAETLDWARGLVALGVRELDASSVRGTLSLVLKQEDDLRKVASKLTALIASSGRSWRAPPPARVRADAACARVPGVGVREHGRGLRGRGRWGRARDAARGARGHARQGRGRPPGLRSAVRHRLPARRSGRRTCSPPARPARRRRGGRPWRGRGGDWEQQ